MPRKKKTIHYLYKTTCLVTDRYYIGMHSTNDLDDGYMGSGRRLRASIRKHGKENHKIEILEFFETRELLVEAEENAITPEMVGDPNCMNLMGGGTGGFISEEQQRNRSSAGGKSNAEKLKNDPEHFKTHSERSSKAMKKVHEMGKVPYDNFKGKTHSDETKQKISETKKGQGKGKKNSQYGTMWIHCKATGEVKKIKKEEWASYLIKSDCPWEKGRK